MRRILLVLPLLFLPLLYSSYSDYVSAKRKFSLIEAEKVRPGSKVSLSPRELNAYVEEEVKKVAPEGIRNPKVELGTGSASGTALIDFVKVRRAQGKSPGWLMSRLLQGEKPVRVNVRIESGSGRAKVEPESVEISGMTIEGKMLDFLIHNYLRSYFPDAKVGEYFELGHRIERLDVKPGGVGVVIGR